jgi:hypothetical protein
MISGYLNDVKIITIIDSKIPLRKGGSTFHRGSNPYIRVKIPSNDTRENQ